jgi:glutaryl-CoA dehydrogenase
MTQLAMDYLGLDALLSAGELAWRDTVRAFVRDRIRPNINDWYEKAVFPAEIVPEMGRLGLLGTHLRGYGCSGRSAVEYGLAALELEAGDSGLRTFVTSSAPRRRRTAGCPGWLPVRRSAASA